MAVMKSLMHEARVRPRTGWVRADQARSPEDRKREQNLVEKLEEAHAKISELERTIGDRAILVDEIPRDQLAQGEDTFEFSVTYRDIKKILTHEKISVSWNDIFKIIGPSLFGYIVRKAG